MYNGIVLTHNTQIKLDPPVRKEIIAELRTPDLLKDNLDVVDIVLGFLSSGKVNAKKPLGEYIDKILKMKKRRFSQKVNIVMGIVSVPDPGGSNISICVYIRLKLHLPLPCICLCMTLFIFLGSRNLSTLSYIVSVGNSVCGVSKTHLPAESGNQ